MGGKSVAETENQSVVGRGGRFFVGVGEELMGEQGQPNNRNNVCNRRCSSPCPLAVIGNLQSRSAIAPSSCGTSNNATYLPRYEVLQYVVICSYPRSEYYDVRRTCRVDSRL